MTDSLRIGFISHEFPPDTGGGGIGTCIVQVSDALAAQGHRVEIFCGATSRTGTLAGPNGILVHRVRGDSAATFRAAMAPVFAEAHAQRPFDVIEGNDFDAPALTIKRTLPALPYVVKLHTPRFVVDELHHREPTLGQRWRMNLGALRRGRLPAASPPIRQQAPAQDEIAAIAIADEIAAPSRAVADAAATWVPGAAERTSVFPYPFAPAPALLGLEPDGRQRCVMFLGRLEERKGVIDLADAIPAVLAVHPDVRFRFVGRAMPSPAAGLDMTAFLSRRLGRHLAAVEFTGPVAPEKVPSLLAGADLLVAPSHWESFGFVCCEGMAAGRAVVGSAAGGMAEILDHGRCGRLVAPRNPAALARVLVDLLHDPAEQRRLGLAGRDRVLSAYNVATVLPAQLASYRRAIARCRNRA